jgi:hypothetical protein
MRRVLLAIAALGAVVSPIGDARISGTSPRLLLSSNRTGFDQIYAVGGSTGRLAQLTFGPDGSIAPVPSPDGRRIAFGRIPLAGYDLRDAELWVMRADGSGQRRVLEGHFTSSPAWSADSRRLAYVVRPPFPQAGVHVVRADGSGDRLVAANGTEPAWSPDGRGLLYAQSGLLVVVRNGRARPLVDGTSGAWSPDGRWIAVANAARRRIDIVRPDGSRRRARIASGGDVGRPSWSPGSRRLAFVDSAGAKVADPTTGRVRTVYRAAGLAGVAWSPGGESLAVTSADGLAVVTLRGRVRRLLVPPPFRYGDDGSRLSAPAWTRPPNGVRYRAAEAVPPAILPEELRLRAPVDQLAADGDRLAFSACRSVGLWHPIQRTAEVVRVESPLCTTSFLRVYSLALAGTEVTFATDEGGIQENIDLTTAGVPIAQRHGTRGDGLGIGWAVGHTSLQVFSTFALRCRPGVTPCAFETVSQSIWRVLDPGSAGRCPTFDGRGPCREIARAEGELVPLAVDSDRIVARRADGTIALLAADGTDLLALPFAPGEALGAELAGDDLVVLVEGELRDYDASTGVLLRAWPLPRVPSGGPCGLERGMCGDPALRLEDAARGLAAYVLDGQLHLLRLADGRDVAIAAATAAQLEETGLFYAYAGDPPYPGRIRFVPFERLPLR